MTSTPPSKVETKSDSVSLTPRAAPSFNLVLWPLLFALAPAIYSQFVDQPACQFDIPSSAVLLMLAVSYLASRSFHYSDLRSPDETPQPAVFTQATYILLAFSPSALFVIDKYQRCASSTMILGEFSSRLYLTSAFVIGVLFCLAIFAAAREPFVGTRQEFGIAKYLTLPVTVLTLALSLGAGEMFGYFAAVIPESFLSFILRLRFGILGIISLAILFDAFRILSPKLALAKKAIDFYADKFFPVLVIDATLESAVLIVGKSIFNFVIVVFRYIFQFGSWAGASLFFFLQSSLVAIWRSIYNSGTKYAIVYSITIILSLLITDLFMGLAQDVRDLLTLNVSSCRIGFMVLFLAFFLLWVCVSYGYMARPRKFYVAPLADGAGIVVGFAIVGIWLCSFAVHSLATLKSVGIMYVPLNAPAFAGPRSLGYFFWLVPLVLCAIVSAALILMYRGRPILTKPAGK